MRREGRKPVAALYAAGGHAYRDADGRPRRERAVEEARSRDGQDVRYAARGHAYRDAGGRPRRERAVEEARSRDGQAVMDRKSGMRREGTPTGM